MSVDLTIAEKIYKLNMLHPIIAEIHFISRRGISSTKLGETLFIMAQPPQPDMVDAQAALFRENVTLLYNGINSTPPEFALRAVELDQHENPKELMESLMRRGRYEFFEGGLTRFNSGTDDLTLGHMRDGKVSITGYAAGFTDEIAGKLLREAHAIQMTNEAIHNALAGSLREQDLWIPDLSPTTRVKGFDKNGLAKNSTTNNVGGFTIACTRNYDANLIRAYRSLPRVTRHWQQHGTLPAPAEPS